MINRMITLMNCCRHSLHVLFKLVEDCKLALEQKKV